MSSSKDHSSSNNDEENDGGHGGWGHAKRAQQLQHLRSLVPNQIETDETSILEGARDYIQRIHEETEQIERELLQQSENYPSSSERQGPEILEVETEELTEGRFIVKIRWRKGSRGVGHVQRVVEGLDVKIISVFVHDCIPDEMLSTAYVEVEKEMRMTEEELQHLVISAARRSGLFP